MQTIKRAFYVLSAEKAFLSRADNQERTKALVSWLNGREAHFKQVIGAWQGNVEHSYLVLDDERFSLADALLTLEQFGQDAALHVDERDEATLVYPSGLTVALGVWTKHKDRPRGAEAWTYDPIRREYYTVVSHLPFHEKNALREE